MNQVFSPPKETLDSIKENVEKNNMVEEVLYIINEPGRDRQFRISIELKNGGRFVAIGSTTSHFLAIAEIARYHGTGMTLDLNFRDWLLSYHDSIDTKWINVPLGYSLNTLNDIINSYDEILIFIEKIFNEPCIPGKLIYSPADWGNEAELKQYTGYVVMKKQKVKIYVTIDESQSVN
jgi:hypothetical protein